MLLGSGGLVWPRNVSRAVVLTQFPQERLDGMEMLIMGKALCTGRGGHGSCGVDHIIISGEREDWELSSSASPLARLTSWK